MRTIIISTLLSLFSVLTFAQENSIAQKVKSHTNFTLEEQIYIHFDRGNYWNGETIWFKAYVASGPNHRVTKLSKTLYVELHNSENELIERKKIRLDQGAGNGEFRLNQESSNSHVTVRAYTNWMRNQKMDSWYQKEIPINLTSRSYDLNTNLIDETLTIDFFPESGSLLAGIENKVAFKAINGSGVGVSVSGKIIDNKGREIVDLRTSHKGMGFVEFTPSSKHEYHAIIDGSDKKYKFPLVEDTGFIINKVEPLTDKEITLNVKSNTKALSQQRIWIIIQAGGNILYHAHQKLNNNSIPIRLPKDQFPKGVLQVSLVDQNGKGLAERLIFNPPNKTNLKAQLNKDIYSVKEKVELDISLAQFDLVNDNVNLSVSVSDDSWDFIEQTNMASQFLLTDDLKGSIEEPNSYFFTDKIDEPNLDLIMLTNGWRKFSSEQILAQSNYEPQFNPESGLTLKGQLLNTRGKKPLKKGTIRFHSFNGEQPQIATVDINEKGQFKFENIEFYDDGKSFLQGLNRHKSNLIQIALNEDFDQAPLNSNLSDSDITRLISKQTIVKIKKPTVNSSDLYASFTRTLSDAIVEDHRERSVTPYFGPGDKTLDFEKIRETQVTTLDISRMLQGVAPSAMLLDRKRHDRMEPNLFTLRGINSINAPVTPLVLIDNVESSWETLVTLSPDDIHSMEIYVSADKTAIFGTKGSNGVIAVFMKRGDDKEVITQDEIDSGRIYLTNGYNSAKEFYKPKYNLEGDLIKEIQNYKDERVLIHWEPNVNTDKQGRAHIEFWTSTKSGTYNLNIQGLTSSGKPISLNKKVKVIDDEVN